MITAITRSELGQLRLPARTGCTCSVRCFSRFC